MTDLNFKQSNGPKRSSKLKGQVMSRRGFFGIRPSPILLPRLLLPLLFLTHGESTSHSAPQPKVGYLLNETSLIRLQREISNQHLDLTIRTQPRSGYRFVGERVRVGRALVINPQLILTSAHLLTLSADESSLTIQVSCPTVSRPIESTLGEIDKMSLKKGWALISIKDTLKCTLVRENGPNLIHSKSDQSLYAGLHLYAYEAPPKRPARITLIGKATAPMNYYWRAAGQLPAGTPLFDERGSMVTFVSQVHYNINTQVNESLILPIVALQSLPSSIRPLHSGHRDE